MADQLLVNVLRVPTAGTLPVGNQVTIAHGLKSNGFDVLPRLIQPDRGTPIVVLSATDTTVTFRNDGTAAEFAFFRLERGLSNEVDAETLGNLYWQGAASGGGGGVPFSALGEVDAPGGPYGAIPAGTLVAVVGGTVVAANAASPATAPAVGIYTGAGSNRIRTSGLYSGLVGLPNNSPVYLAVGGGFTATSPSVAGQVSQYIGRTIGTTEVFVDLESPLYL